MTTDYDADQINHRAALARAWLGDDPDVDLDKGADALRALADEDVPALLCALEEATVRDDTGYIRGLRAAVRWLAAVRAPKPDPANPKEPPPCMASSSSRSRPVASPTCRPGISAPFSASTPTATRSSASTVQTLRSA